MNTEQLKNRLNSKIETITQERKMEAMQENTIIAEQGYIALRDNTIDIIKQNLKNQPLSFQLFDTVKAPSGGSTVFTIPGISGDEIEKSISGIILDYTTPRAYWETPDPVEGTPPTCYSADSIVSTDGKACSKGLKNKPCKRNNRQNSDNTKNAAKQGNAEERPDAGCGIKR